MERTSARAVTRFIMPSGFQIPEEAQSAPSTLVSTACPLPAMWDLSTERTARLALSTLMPGHWPVGHVHAIMAQGVTFRESPAPAHADRVTLSHIMMSRCKHVTPCHYAAAVSILAVCNSVKAIYSAGHDDLVAHVY